MLQLSMQTVVAALIWAGDRILIAQRSASGPHPLKWEFPGGKVERGETARQALMRELREELGVETTVGIELANYNYAYPGKAPIHLIFFKIEGFTGPIENQGAFETLVWETVSNLARYDFLEGDLMLVELLGKVQIDQV